MRDLVRRAMYFGLGAISMTKEKAEQLVDELVKKGEINQGEAKEFVDNLVERGKREQEELRAMIRQEINNIKEEMPFVSRRQFEELEKRVAQLERELAQYSAPQEPSEF